MPDQTDLERADLVTTIIEYEEVGLPPRQELELFSYLIRTGQAFELQGRYGRRAVEFLEAGYILPNGDTTGAGLAVFGEDDEEEPARYVYGAEQEAGREADRGRGV